MVVLIGNETMSCSDLICFFSGIDVFAFDEDSLTPNRSDCDRSIMHVVFKIIRKASVLLHFSTGSVWDCLMYFYYYYLYLRSSHERLEWVPVYICWLRINFPHNILFEMTRCSGGRIVSWIIYCWLVWCERKTLFLAGVVIVISNTIIHCPIGRLAIFSKYTYPSIHPWI